MNENLIEIINIIANAQVFYKDDEIYKTCKKTVAEFEFADKDKINSITSRLLSFIRTYHPVDLVSPLKRENDQLKIIIYSLIDYL